MTDNSVFILPDESDLLIFMHMDQSGKKLFRCDVDWKGAESGVEFVLLKEKKVLLPLPYKAAIM
jgi:hypothetical protein